MEGGGDLLRMALKRVWGHRSTVIISGIQLRALSTLKIVKCEFGGRAQSVKCWPPKHEDGIWSMVLVTHCYAQASLGLAFEVADMNQQQSPVSQNYFHTNFQTCSGGSLMKEVVEGCLGLAKELPAPIIPISFPISPVCTKCKRDGLPFPSN